jgi:hypothetical protein
LVFKEVVTNKFRRGRVIEGMVAADNSITLTSTHSRVSDGDTIHQGVVTIASSLESSERFLQPQVVRLSDAKERYYQEIMYLAFPPSQASSIRLKVLVPNASTLSASPEIKLRLRILGRTAGTLPSLTATYRILPNPVGAGVVALPTSDSALTISTAHAVDADEYISVDSEAETVDGQDIVFFTLSRAAGDGYAGEVGIIEVVAVLT